MAADFFCLCWVLYPAKIPLIEENWNVLVGKKHCVGYQNGTKFVNQHTLNNFLGWDKTLKKQLEKNHLNGEEKCPGY